MRQMNEYLIKTLGLTSLECDELWSNAQRAGRWRCGGGPFELGSDAHDFIHPHRNQVLSHAHEQMFFDEIRPDF